MEKAEYKYRKPNGDVNYKRLRDLSRIALQFETIKEVRDVPNNEDLIRRNILNQETTNPSLSLSLALSFFLPFFFCVFNLLRHDQSMDVIKVLETKFEGKRSATGS